MHSAKGIEVDVFFGREEHETLAALEQAVEVVVEIMVLAST